MRYESHMDCSDNESLIKYYQADRYVMYYGSIHVLGIIFHKTNMSKREDRITVKWKVWCIFDMPKIHHKSNKLVLTLKLWFS